MSNHRMDYLIHTTQPTPKLTLYTHIVYYHHDGARIETHHYGEAAAMSRYDQLLAVGWRPRIESVTSNGSVMDQPMAGQEMTQ